MKYICLKHSKTWKFWEFLESIRSRLVNIVRKCIQSFFWVSFFFTQKNSTEFSTTETDTMARCWGRVTIWGEATLMVPGLTVMGVFCLAVTAVTEKDKQDPHCHNFLFYMTRLKFHSLPSHKHKCTQNKIVVEQNHACISQYKTSIQH